MITLKNITKSYTLKEAPFNALDDVSVTFPNKGFVALFGDTGSGKSTLLNLVGGLDTPTKGSIHYKNKDVSTFTQSDWNTYRAKTIGFIFQSFHLLDYLTVRENIALAIKVQSTSKTVDSQVERVLNEVNLLNKADHYPHELSGGESQKVAIARALIKNPDVIVADEPTGSLDETSALSILALLKTIAKDKLVIVVSHQKALVTPYQDYYLQLEKGKIIHNTLPFSVDKTTYIKPMPIKFSFKKKVMHSYLNLKARWLKTVLFALIASIGMMGMLLVMSLSFGFDDYIETQKEETLYAFPIRVESTSLVVPIIDGRYAPSFDPHPNDSYAYPQNIQSEFIATNRLNKDYFDYVQTLDTSLTEYIHYEYQLHPPIIHKLDEGYHHLSMDINPFPMNNVYINEHYDILVGESFSESPYEVIIVIDKYNRIPKDVIMNLGFSGDDRFSLESLLDFELKLIDNDVFYSLDNTTFEINDLETAYNDDRSTRLEVRGVIRLKDTEAVDLIAPGIYYNPPTVEQVLVSSATSEIVLAQLQTTINVLTNASMNEAQHQLALRRLGYADYPSAYTIYPESFESKDMIMTYLHAYNDTVSRAERIEPLDLAGIGLAIMRLAIDAISVVLYILAFISLVISTVVIALLTYTSILKRRHEIGLLKSLGAKNGDIASLFYFETMMVSLTAFVFALILAMVSLPLINSIIYYITSIERVGNLTGMIILTIFVLTFILTSIASIIPARIAAKQDPVKTLHLRE